MEKNPHQGTSLENFRTSGMKRITRKLENRLEGKGTYMEFQESHGIDFSTTMREAGRQWDTIIKILNRISSEARQPEFKAWP